VKKGVVTLTGFVRSYMEKYEAERAAKRVSGVAPLITCRRSRGAAIIGSTADQGQDDVSGSVAN
jgi:hypothetical protein